MIGARLKLPAIIVIALAVNVLMFTAIEYMVGMKRVRLTETSDLQVANFIRMAEQSQDVRSRRDPTAPQKPQAEMQQDIVRLAQGAGAVGDVRLSVQMPEVDLNLSGNIQIARELTPLVRVAAEYPMSALGKRIEGFVELRFTVTEAGTVEDPEVIRAFPEGVFETAALRAVRKWKYQPQMVDGQPRAVITYTRVRFELMKEAL
jgi:protein TonB